MLFADRRDAGRALASLLPQYSRQDAVVLALPRGGVPVGYELARALSLPLDVFVVRKLGAPGQEELAMGAIASGGVRVLNHEVVQALGISEWQIEAAARREQEELERRERQYRGDSPPLDVRGRVAILTDDGLATGSTMRAAIRAVRQQQPLEVIVAVPVAAAATCREFESEADRIVCAHTPEHFHAVGQWYQDFSQTSDEEVRRLLESARAWRQDHVA